MAKAVRQDIMSRRKRQSYRIYEPIDGIVSTDRPVYIYNNILSKRS